MKLNAGELLSRLTASYWFIPLLVTLAGTGSAALLLQLDSRVQFNPDSAMSAFVPQSVEGARSLLSAIIGAMITAISVTFSVSIVALTVAAQHFGPRVVNNYVRNRAAQAVLGTFMATFIYAVLVLGSIESGARMPFLAITGAVILVLASVGALIYYVHYVSTALQVGELTAEIADDFRHALDGNGGQAAAAAQDVPEPPDDPGMILSNETGYVQRIDYGLIAAAAAARNAIVWMRREPGAFTTSGVPLALVHPASACDDELVQLVRRASVVGRDRTLWHDPEFAAKQLVEIALRALSPGVNEPFTATTCIDRLTEGLAAALQTDEPSGLWTDAEGVVRVIAKPQTFRTFIRSSFDPIRIFAGPNPAIYARLADALGELALVARRPDDVGILREQLELVREAVRAQAMTPYDQSFVDTRLADAHAQLRQEPSPQRS